MNNIESVLNMTGKKREKINRKEKANKKRKRRETEKKKK
jgi:hypothetical protein